MAIQEQNIVYLRTQVMDDVPEGGGAAIGEVVVDGAMNNVFEDPSDLDRVYGRLNLRGLALGVRSLDTDLYGGAKTAITGLPADPALGYALFTIDNPFGTRAEAANRVEAYLYKGPLWHGVLNENHIKNMQAISVIQRVNTALPPVGKTLCLVQDEGLSTEQEQYVRVIQVDAVETTFTDDQGDYVRWIVTMSLSGDLLYDFTGHTVNRYDTYNYTGKTRIRDTTVANAAKFYGSTRVAEAAQATELKIRATSMFAQLVPSAETPTSLVNQPMSNQQTPMIASRATTLSYTVAGAVIAPNGKIVLDTGAYPGSISVTVGGVTITDDGAGNAIHSGTTVGLWTYATGDCALGSSAPSASGTATISYIPAAAVAMQSHTRAITVTAENRRLNWIETLAPIPLPSTFTLAYMAQGNWYVLSDNGAGTVSGSDPSFGAGTVSYITGAAPVTLGALPDVGSQLMLAWATPVHTSIQAGNAAIDTKIIVTHSLGEAFKPGTMTITWPVGGVEKTATVAVDGTISGDCTGYASAVIGDLRLEFTVPPDANSQIGLDYQRVTQTQQTFTGVSAPGGIAVVDLGEAVEPGSITLLWSTQSTIKWDKTIHQVDLYYGPSGWVVREVTTTITSESVRRYDYRSTDNGLGEIIGSGGSANYSGGELTLPLLPAMTQNVYDVESSGWTSHSESEEQAFVSGVVNVWYTPAGAAQTAVSIEIDLPPLQIKVIPRLLDETLVPGGLRFAWNGHVYIERNGTIYRDVSPATGAGTPAGTMNYLDGVATLTDYVTGSGAVTISALLTRFGDWTAVEASFRAALAPLKPEALSIVAVTDDGEQITGSADADGVISGTWMRGDANYQFGVSTVEFGQLDGATWVTRAVDPSTIRYSAVAYSYLPLNADILGIDPVRLPPDGRVPIYRAGDVVVILHPQTNAPATPTLGDYTYTNSEGVEVTVQRYILSCGRTRIGWVKINDNNGDTVALQTAVDANGVRLSGLDRKLGVVYWDDISALATPLTVKHTVADLRMITDAQISGWLTLARSLSHDFPADESIIAACLIHGDRRARVKTTWDQASWDGVWRDAIYGSAATATLNLIDYPIEVTNEGADTERWVFRCTNAASNLWELIGEHRGLVWSGTYEPYISGTPVDVAPINPRTRDENGQNGTPYMVIPQRANGGGWSNGNVVFIPTVGAIADFWIARSIQQSDEPDDDGADGCEIYALGNIDRP